MSNLENIVKSLSSLTIMEAAELSKMLEAEWGVSAATQAAPAAPVVASAAAEVQKTSFDVILTSFGESKLNVIKTVKEILASDLTSAKNLVESAPKAIKTGVTKDEAESIKSKLEAVGAKIDIT
jgi:large subunit ribosomal protein L7/L12